MLGGCGANPVTGEAELILFSAESEIEFGQRRFGPAQPLGGGLYTKDPSVSEYMSAVGNRIAAASDRDLPYEFVVLNSSIPDAWSIPGGKTPVTPGLFMELQSEAELAAILSHQVVHATARHDKTRLNRRTYSHADENIGSLPGVGIATAATLSIASGVVGAIAFEVLDWRHEKGAELEVDDHGMRNMHAAGYDTRAAQLRDNRNLRQIESAPIEMISGVAAAARPASALSASA